MQELLNRIRPVTDDDKNLPVFSYSKMEVFKNCPLQYRYKYIEKKYSQDTSIALELGSLCHYVLEQKGKMIVSGETVDYEKLNDILMNGVTETDEKTKEELLGVNQLKRKYFEVWHEADNASGASYDEKIKLFDKVLHNEMEETALAILNEFGVLPIESEYRFILIDDKQYALTKGWENRLIKAMDKVFGDIEASEKKSVFVPKPSPLCHWCNFCQTNPEATIYRNECEYFSKWTPTQKTFEVNKKWNALENINTAPKRKLVF